MSTELPPLRVLLFHDHHDTRTILARLLRYSGVEVDAVETCHEALEAASAAAASGQPYDLAMSRGQYRCGGRGPATLAQLKRRHGCATLAMLARSPETYEGHVPELLDDWIQIPMDVQPVLKILDNIATQRGRALPVDLKVGRAASIAAKAAAPSAR